VNSWWNYERIEGDDCQAEAGALEVGDEVVLGLDVEHEDH